MPPVSSPLCPQLRSAWILEMHYKANMQITSSPVSAVGDLCLLLWAAQESSHHLCNQPQGLCGLNFVLGDFYLPV